MKSRSTITNDQALSFVSKSFLSQAKVALPVWYTNSSYYILLSYELLYNYYDCDYHGQKREDERVSSSKEVVDNKQPAVCI